jgi:hypothetical protein
MTRLRLLFATFLLVLFAPFLASSASAACTGSNLTWTSTPDRASVAQCISNASAGATINVSAGSATWTSDIDISKSVTVAGAGIGSTVITGHFNILDAMQGVKVRITGFTFNLGSGSFMSVWSTQVFRVDHCRFTRSNHDWLIFVGGNANFSTEGLFDHNQFLNGSVVVFGQADPLNGSLQWSQPLDLGTSHAVYIEDNVFDFDSQSGSYPGSLDGNHGSRVVFRFNTNHGGRLEQHSLQGDNQRGVRMWEFYNNSFTNPSFQNYRPFFIRGGTGMVFHNTSDGRFLNNGLDIDNARSSEGSIANQVASFGMCTGSSRADGNTANFEGWPCRDQIGRSTDASLWSNFGTTGPAQASFPAFFWRNTQPSGEIPVDTSCESADAACNRQNTKHLLFNRDFYAYQSSFNGTAGVGEGPLSNRPATCTKGVGYWATDQGSWNQSPSNPQGVQANGADGQLYTCTATNTWSLTYVPYSYPHPLQAGGSSTTPPPSAPANLRIVK